MLQTYLCFIAGAVLGVLVGWLTALLVGGRYIQPRVIAGPPGPIGPAGVSGPSGPPRPTKVQHREVGAAYSRGYSDGWCDAAGVVEVDFGAESAA